MSPGNSAIEWTTKTWNPITGCSHVSAGCDNCYAARETSGRLKNLPQYKDLAIDGKFTGEIRLLPDRLEEPLKWRKPAHVFVNSMSDLFHADVPAEYIARVFDVMARTRQHTYQVLTKRPARMRMVLGHYAECEHGWLTHNGDNPSSYGGTGIPIAGLSGDSWPLRNVWLGTSIEDQEANNKRLQLLLATPAAVHFVSAEPLIGPVNFGLTPAWNTPRDGPVEMGSLDWVIVGGESGPNARPMHPDWARHLRDYCVSCGIPYFFKQWGEWLPLRDREQLDLPPDDRKWIKAYGEAFVRVGKKAAGRELDGRTWDEMPEAINAA